MLKSFQILTSILVISSIKVCAQDDYLSKTLVDFKETKRVMKQDTAPKLVYEMSDEIEEYLLFTDSLDRINHSKPGFRIQIYSNSGPSAKENAVKEQSKFLNIYQDVDSYTTWSYPNWCVRVGNFRTKLEALEFHLAIRELYPASFIMSDEIEVEY